MLHDRTQIDEQAVVKVVEEARQFAHPLKAVEDLDPLIKRIGDASHTDMARADMFNIGQLAREKHQNEGVVLVGFGSYYGSVIAGKSWDAPMEQMEVPEARMGSWEDTLHQAGESDQLLIFGQDKVSDEFQEPRGHRAIGVVYHPEFESRGNYVPTVLPKRYDAFLFIDETEDLHPLHIQPEEVNPPDTYPWGV